MKVIISKCREIVEWAGVQSRRAFEKNAINPRRKVDKTYVSDWDEKIERRMRTEIEKNFPKHSICGEELADVKRGSKYTWYLDPIDGTSNFVSSLPVFCNMACVAKKNKVVAAAVRVPIINKTYWAGEGMGTHINERLVKIGKNEKLSKVALVIDRGHSKGANGRYRDYHYHYGGRFRSVARYGSMAAGPMMVFSGRPAAHIVFGSEIYDLAPVAYLYQRAGFVVINAKGKSWSLGDADLVACHPGNLDEILKTFS